MHVAVWAFGTRGDVQPCAALAIELRQRGHEVTVYTDRSYQRLFEDDGVHLSFMPEGFKEVLMADLRAREERHQNGVRGRLRYYLRKLTFPDYFRRLMVVGLEVTRGAQVVVFGPTAFGAAHVADALRIPKVLMAPFPGFVPTGVLSNAAVRKQAQSPRARRRSYSRWRDLEILCYRKTVNKWRRDELGLASLPFFGPDLVTIHGSPELNLHCYSAAASPRPQDWPDNSHVTGYWFLDDKSGLDGELEAFLSAGEPPVCIGFGSPVAPGAEERTRMIMEGVKRAGLRAVLLSGFGAMEKIQHRADIFFAQAAPHGLLFDRVSAVVHHGGAGTTGAVLRSGVPGLICPFFDDQYFWGSRVRELGVGPQPIPIGQLTASKLAEALVEMTSDRAMRDRALSLAKDIRQENGTGRAIALLEELVARPSLRGFTPHTTTASAGT